MSHDFAKKPKPKRQPPKPKSQVPGWVWLFTGTALGAFIMFLVHLNGLTPEAPVAFDQPQAKTQTAQSKAVASKPKASSPQFDFYTLLEDSTVEVAEPTEPAQARVKMEYLLQVASFKHEDDAEGLRAELILMNLEAYSQSVKVKGEDWFRVMVGPFDNRSRLAKARGILVSNNHSPVTLKRKAEG